MISNLGVFDFETPDHAMRIRSVHPGVTVDAGAWRSPGFALVVPDDVPETPGFRPTTSSSFCASGSTRSEPARRNSGASPAMASALDTELCSILGIRYPILQTAMGWIATPELVAASSNAGAMGFLATANLRPDEVDREIGRVKQLTDRPFEACRPADRSCRAPSGSSTR